MSRTSKAVPQSIPVYLIDNSEFSELSLADFEDSRLQADHLGVELRLLHGHGNVGYGAAHNLLINDLESEFHLMLNPDVVLDKLFLATGINYLIAHKGVALVAPMASHETGERQFLCKRYPSVFTLFVRGFLPRNSHKLFTKRLARYEMRDLHAEQINDDIPIASGCCMLTRSSALTAIKGFDARYFLYFEDFDLSLRIRQQGRIAYLPTMKLFTVVAMQPAKALAMSACLCARQFASLLSMAGGGSNSDSTEQQALNHRRYGFCRPGFMSSSVGAKRPSSARRPQMIEKGKKEMRFRKIHSVVVLISSYSFASQRTLIRSPCSSVPELF